MSGKQADLAGPGISTYEEVAKILPDGYDSLLTPKETMKALYGVKNYIEENLDKELNLNMVQVPIAPSHLRLCDPEPDRPLPRTAGKNNYALIGDGSPMQPIRLTDQFKRLLALARQMTESDQAEAILEELSKEAYGNCEPERVVERLHSLLSHQIPETMAMAMNLDMKVSALLLMYARRDEAVRNLVKTVKRVKIQYGCTFGSTGMCCRYF